MALDVYVGSLTRYYAGDWESIADKKGRRTRPARTKAARAKGTRVGEPDKDSERIRRAVLAWREGLARTLIPPWCAATPTAFARATPT